LSEYPEDARASDHMPGEQEWKKQIWTGCHDQKTGQVAQGHQQHFAAKHGRPY
jgi:hypothetical protein